MVALVEWGATTSQIIAHTDRMSRSGASTAQRSTVETFERILYDVIAPVLAGRSGAEIRRAADLIATIEQTVRDEILLVPVAAAGPALLRLS